MKRKLELLTLNLVLIILLSSCYPYMNDQVLKEWPKYVSHQGTQISLEGIVSPAAQSCAVHAVDLLDAWVTAGALENDPFPFTELNGKVCQGTFEADILPLFSQANLWYAGAPSCRTCHGPDVQVSYARLDLSSYQGIMAGSSRESADTKGDDILGAGDWNQAKLKDVLTNGEMPPSQPAKLNPLGPVIYVGISQ
jgi:hypothetical protein